MADIFTRQTGRVCWVCLGNQSEDEANAEWVAPCNCQGTSEWVHQHCIQQWIDEKQDGCSTTNVSCPQCLALYTIQNPTPSFAVSLLEYVDRSINNITPFLAFAVGTSALYICSVAYGAIAVVQFVGWRDGMKFLRQLDPLTFFFSLPTVPVMLIVPRFVSPRISVSTQREPQGENNHANIRTRINNNNDNASDNTNNGSNNNDNNSFGDQNITGYGDNDNDNASTSAQGRVGTNIAPHHDVESAYLRENDDDDYDDDEDEYETEITTLDLNVAVEDSHEPRMSAARALVGGLLFPSVAWVCGRCFSDKRNNFQRSLLGGVTFLLFKNMIRSWYRNQRSIILRDRRVLNSHHPAASEQN